MKKALIIINVSKDESMTLAKEIASYLKKKDVAYDFLSFDGFVDNTDFKGYDFVISLGGGYRKANGRKKEINIIFFLEIIENRK